MAQQLRVLAVPAEAPIWVPRTHTGQLPVTPVLKESAPLASAGTYAHKCIPPHRQAHN